MDIQELIDSDRKFIRETSTVAFLRDRILGGHSRILTEIQNSNLRQNIADHFEVHINSIIIVGSAKLGYSVSPRKPLRHFGNNSDVDVAIVDRRLFERYWLSLYKAKDLMIEWPEISKVKAYLFKGWIRPDQLPLIDLKNEWFDFFSSLQRAEVGGPYPVRGGLYHSIEFLEHYQKVGVSKCFEGAD